MHSNINVYIPLNHMPICHQFANKSMTHPFSPCDFLIRQLMIRYTAQRNYIQNEIHKTNPTLGALWVVLTMLSIALCRYGRVKLFN